MSTGLLQGKRGLIMGLANDKSIAWGIAKACADAGRRAGLHLSGRGAAASGSQPLAASVGYRHRLQCDVADEASIDAAFAH